MVNAGRNVGRVSIRVMPDTQRFAPQLKRQLELIERRTHFTVNVDRVNFDREKIQADINKETSKLRDVFSNVTIVIDKARLDKRKVRADIQRQIDELKEFAIKIKPELTKEKRFLKDVDRLVDKAEKNKVKIPVELGETLTARARLARLARNRFVTIIPKISTAAAAKVATALAALTGGRLAFNVFDDVFDFFAHLDENLPKLNFFVTGIASLLSVLVSATGGILGIGAGLANMIPALLLLPGLLLNGLASLVVLIVALKDGKEQLAELGPAFTNLGKIISTDYWAAAKQPIVDMVNTLMPQLETSMSRAAKGLGAFTASMAKAFEIKLADGRLDAIFANIEKGWYILAEGADQFAGAIVSLSEIAARYMPRLATWFVRIADQFDGWLEEVANDGRLDGWIEKAITAFYDVGDVLWATIGIFDGLWRAAERAGSQGLSGFADNMLRIRDIVQGEQFQTAMTGIFRGADVATQGLGRGLGALLQIFTDLQPQIEYLIGESGQAFGDILEGIANLVNQPMVADGLIAAIDGVRAGIKNFFDNVDPVLVGEMARAMGEFIGKMNEAFGTTMADTLNSAMPAMTSILEDLTAALPGIQTAVDSFVKDDLPGILEKIVENIPDLLDGLEDIAELLDESGPLFLAAATDIAEGIENIGKAIDFVTDLLSDLQYALNLGGKKIEVNAGEPDFSQWTHDFFAGIFGETDSEWEKGGPSKETVEQRMGLGHLNTSISETSGNARVSREQLTEFGDKSAESLRERMGEGSSALNGIATSFNSTGTTADGLGGKVTAFGDKAASDLATKMAEGTGSLNGIGGTFTGTGLPVDGLGGKMSAFATGAATNLATGMGLGTGALNGIAGTFTSSETNVAGLGGKIGSFASTSESTLSGFQGRSKASWSSHWQSMDQAPRTASGTIGEAIMGGLGSIPGRMMGIGTAMITGLINGITSMARNVATAAATVVQGAVSAAEAALNINSPSRVVRDRVGKPFVEGLVVGIDGGQKSARQAASRLMLGTVDAASSVPTAIAGVSSRMGTASSDPVVNIQLDGATAFKSEVVAIITQQSGKTSRRIMAGRVV